MTSQQKPRSAIVLLVAASLFAGGCEVRRVELLALQPSISEERFTPPDDPLFRLGQLLFFDRELSGNRNIACATCHFPFATTVENLPLSLGQGASGLGPTRSRGEGAVLPRNSMALFAEADAPALFWDGRVERRPDGSISAPVALPEGIRTTDEALVLLPLFDRSEMRGDAGDVDVFGERNELAQIDDSRVFAEALLRRVLRFEEYEFLLDLSFPGEAPTFAHLARAMVHFRQELWSHPESDWDLREETPVSRAAEAGAALFFGDAGCVRCHDGPDFGGTGFFNIGVPQLGPGFAPMMSDGTTDLRPGLDEGRFNTTGRPEDRFAFRVPPLRNVRMTGPWMHNGAYATLEEALRHHLDPQGALEAYDGAGLPASIAETVQNDPATRALILETLSDEVQPLRPLTDADIALLLEFLAALDSERERSSLPASGVPDFVPSGLEVDRWPGGPHPFR
ncbi:MAG: cytochrome-c peroxidase [Polyangiales bacterium]